MPTFMKIIVNCGKWWETVLFGFYEFTKYLLLFISKDNRDYIFSCVIYANLLHAFDIKWKIRGEEDVLKMQFCVTVLMFVCSGGARFMHCACHHRRRGNGE